MTNESALLGLLADMYRDVASLRAENAWLRAQLPQETQRPVDDDARPSTD